MKKTIIGIIIICSIIGGIIGFGVFFFSQIIYPCPSCPVIDNVITITKDRQFNNYKSSGSGTAEEPYIIENRVLGSTITFVKKMYIALEIRGTSKHFIVRNCTIYGGSPGVLISSISSNTGIIENCSIIAVIQTSWDNLVPRGGIKIENSDGVILRNNTHIENDALLRIPEFSYHGYGVIIENCENYMIEDNLIQCDTVLINSPTGDVRYNKVDGSLDLYSSSHVEIYNNSFRSIYYYYEDYYRQGEYNYRSPIRILECSDINIFNNFLNRSMSSNVVIIENSELIYIKNNTIYVYSLIISAENVSTLHITNNTIYRENNETNQFDLVNCTDVINLDNIIHEDLVEITTRDEQKV